MRCAAYDWRSLSVSVVTVPAKHLGCRRHLARYTAQSDNLLTVFACLLPCCDAVAVLLLHAFAVLLCLWCVGKSCSCGPRFDLPCMNLTSMNLKSCGGVPVEA